MRRKFFQLTDEAVAGILKTRDPQTISVDGVPADAIFIAMHHDPLRRMVYVIFEHDSFPDEPEYVPYVRGETPTITVHHQEET